MAPRLLIEGLRKSYGSREVLKGVSLSIEPGQIVALLGPNGAGKTTLISIVAGLRRASGGRVEVEGIDVLRNAAATRDLMGLASQDTAVYPTVTVRDNLRFFAEVAGVAKNVIDERVVSVAASFGLGDLLDTKARFLSGGERRRLHTAIALVHEPPLLLLDEPTVGADVRTRSELVAHVASLATRGAAVLYCTHYLSEVEELGPDVVVAILDHGTIVASGPVRSLYADVGRSAAHVAFCAAVSDDQIGIMQKTAPPGADVRRLDQSTVVVSAARPSEAAIAVVNQAAASIPELRSVTMVGTTLDDVFLSITGRPYEIGDSE